MELRPVACRATHPLRHLHLAVERQIVTRVDAEVRRLPLPQFGLGETLNPQAEGRKVRRNARFAVKLGLEHPIGMVARQPFWVALGLRRACFTPEGLFITD